jgi:Amt family ammonium transporter
MSGLEPHNIPLVAIGTGLLWFGWYGFNAGSELKVDQITCLAFLNTDLAGSVAAVTWLLVAWRIEKKPKFLGLLTGSIAGLATITPCAGFVTPNSAIIIGILAGIVCYFAISLKNKLGWDDALDVWGVHGVGGGLGAILLGVFGITAVNTSGFDGVISGGSFSFLFRQTVAVVAAAVYAFLFSYIILYTINLVTPVKVSAEHEESGLDEALHGEQAYI